jgi:hypothetical protein
MAAVGNNGLNVIAEESGSGSGSGSGLGDGSGSDSGSGSGLGDGPGVGVDVGAEVGCCGCGVGAGVGCTGCGVGAGVGPLTMSTSFFWPALQCPAISHPNQSLLPTLAEVGTG